MDIATAEIGSATRCQRDPLTRRPISDTEALGSMKKKYAHIGESWFQHQNFMTDVLARVRRADVRARSGMRIFVIAAMNPA